MTRFKKLGDIPNQAGLVIRVFTRQSEYSATVCKGDSGSYYLKLPDGVLWSDLVGWL